MVRMIDPIGFPYIKVSFPPALEFTLTAPPPSSEERDEANPKQDLQDDERSQPQPCRRAKPFGWFGPVTHRGPPPE